MGKVGWRQWRRLCQVDCPRLQIVNVPHPNSVNNTNVFTAFVASVSVTNLHVALDCYKDQVTGLQKTQ